MAREGSRVVVTDIDLEGAQRLATEIEQGGSRPAIALRLDVTKREEVDTALTAVLDWAQRVDIWVNNAGVSTMNHFVDLTEAEWDYMMQVNARGVFLCSQAAGRQMIAQGKGGRIISVASMAGKRGGVPLLAHYVASKFAVVGLTQAMAFELASYGILVNAVCPGYVTTSMQEREVEWSSLSCLGGLQFYDWPSD
jgi:NAD(P)-dependent dehydrogenase (short-subunit alcohol dehydrogenase family)